MQVEVKVPVLSESVAEATLVSWHKKQGEYVERDENLIDIETDKVVMELPAPVSGTLTKIVKGDGATVVSSELIATIDTEITAPPKKGATAGKKPAATEKPAGKKSTVTERPVMMPAAKRVAAEKGIGAEEINTIRGSGRGGRITKEDMA